MLSPVNRVSAYFTDEISYTNPNPQNVKCFLSISLVNRVEGLGLVIYWLCLHWWRMPLHVVLWVPCQGHLQLAVLACQDVSCFGDTLSAHQTDWDRLSRGERLQCRTNVFAAHWWRT